MRFEGSPLDVLNDDGSPAADGPEEYVDFLELRYLDAQPLESWEHPVALLAALFSRQSLVESVLEVCEPVADRWSEAARHGLGDPRIAAAARTIADLGCSALSSLDLPEHRIVHIADAVDRRLRRGERQ